MTPGYNAFRIHFLMHIPVENHIHNGSEPPLASQQQAEISRERLSWERIHSEWVSLFFISHFKFVATRNLFYQHWIQHAAFEHRRDQNWVCFYFLFVFYLASRSLHRLLSTRLSTASPSEINLEFQHHSRQGRSESECRSD